MASWKRDGLGTPGALPGSTADSDQPEAEVGVLSLVRRQRGSGVTGVTVERVIDAGAYLDRIGCNVNPIGCSVAATLGAV